MAMRYMPKLPQLTERICAYGQNGVGKTSLAISMMRRMPDRHFHVLDTNASYEFSIYEDDERNAKVIAAQNFTIYDTDPQSWLDQVAKMAEIEAECEPGDWAVFDMMDDLWDAIPSWYTETFLGLDETAYRQKVRMALEEKRNEQQAGGQKGDRTAPLFDQLRDYQHINPTYKRQVYGLMRRLNAKGVHVLCLAGAKSIGDNDDVAIRKRYRPFKERPASQKALTGEMNTVLHLAWDGEDTWTMSQAKDRGSRLREQLDEEPWDDFCKTYLSPIAGWHMEKVED